MGGDGVMEGDAVTDEPERPGGAAAVVVGGTGGIGGAVVRLLVRRGERVHFTYRANSERAAALVDELAHEPGAPVSASSLDLSDDAAIAGFADAVTARFGSVRTLVHAAGPVVRQRHLSRVEPGEMRSILVGDAAAFFSVARAFLPVLRESHGSITAVTSAAGRRFAVRDGMSVVPKASVEAIVTGLAVEEGRFGVRANCVGPGMLSDGMAATLTAAGDLDEAALEAARRNTPLRRFGDCEDIAEAVSFLASDRADFISGQKLDVDGGYGA